MSTRTWVIAAVGVAVLIVVAGGAYLLGAQRQEAQRVQKASEGSTAPGARGGGPVFVGEHENLTDGDTVEWRSGAKLTVSDIHIGRSRRIPKGGVETHEEGVVARVEFNNSSPATVDPKQRNPCSAVDSNGVSLTPFGPEEQKGPGQFANPIEPGQTRVAIQGFALPSDGGEMEIRCTMPGGDPLQVMPDARATWLVDPSTLPSR